MMRIICVSSYHVWHRQDDTHMIRTLRCTSLAHDTRHCSTQMIRTSANVPWLLRWAGCEYGVAVNVVCLWMWRGCECDVAANVVWMCMRCGWVMCFDMTVHLVGSSKHMTHPHLIHIHDSSTPHPHHIHTSFTSVKSQLSAQLSAHTWSGTSVCTQMKRHFSVHTDEAARQYAHRWSGTLVASHLPSQ